MKHFGIITLYTYGHGFYIYKHSSFITYHIQFNNYTVLIKLIQLMFMIQGK